MYVLHPPRLETGPLHIGGIRTALYNYLFAKKHGGDFILRVEDTDSKREVSGAINYITESFKWLGITPNEGYGIGGEHGPYIQSERKDIYKEYVDKLVDLGNAYYAFDSREELAKMKEDLKTSGVHNTGYAGTIRERMKNSLFMSKEDVKVNLDAGDPYVVRFKMPRGEVIKFKDEVRGWVSFDAKNLDDKVIWKSSDGLPTYHMANVIDDHLMEITHVIRGEEWVTSTPLHVLLYKAFGWDHPIFVHLPLILAPNNKKLGKRDGDKYGIPIFPIDWDYTDSEGTEVSVSGFREAGYEPDALLNFVALLGWNPGDNIEHMSEDEMVNSFTLNRINQAGAMFDMKKLNSFNSHYIRLRDKKIILDNIDMPDVFISRMTEDRLDMIASMAVERSIFMSDLSSNVDYLYIRPDLESEFKTKNIDEFMRVMHIFLFEGLEGEFDDKEWTADHLMHELNFISSNMDVKVGKIMPMLRIALTGGKPGPSLAEIMYILGSKESRKRIKYLMHKLKTLA